MKIIKSIPKYNILKKIENREISQPERMKIKSQFLDFLKDPTATLENYPQKTIVKALMQHYPGTLDPQEISEYTQYKVNFFMKKIYNLIVNNRKVYANPLLIKMILDHLKGNDEIDNINQQIVIQNWFPTSDQGKHTLPEPKIKILDVEQ